MKYTMMPLVIENASILLGEDLEHVERGYVEIDERGIITAAGEGRSPSSRRTGKKLDADGSFLVMPGLINAHTHIADSIGKDIAAGSRLDARVHPVFGAKKKILEKSPPAQLAAMIKSSAVSMLHKGITAFADFREGGPEGVRLLRGATAGLPIKCVALGRVDHYSCDPAGKGGLPANAAATAKQVMETADGLGISGANENTDAALGQYREMASAATNNRLVAIHAAESAETVQFSRDRTGRSEVERIMQHLKPDVLVHMTHATGDEMSLARAGSAGIVVCPRANGVLGAGLPRVAEMLKRGCLVAIGTDNVMLNSPDMFREMDYLWKASHAQGDFIEPRQLVKMATANAAKMLGLNSGWIAPGRAADLVFVDKRHADLYPVHDPYAAIVHRASKDAVRAVMAGGRFVSPSITAGGSIL